MRDAAAHSSLPTGAAAASWTVLSSTSTSPCAASAHRRNARVHGRADGSVLKTRCRPDHADGYESACHADAQAKLELCTGPASGEGHTRCPDLACQFQCPLRVILKANRCAHQNEHAIACLILDRTANARCCHTTSQVIASLLASIPEPRAFESEKTVGNRRDSSGPPARGLPIRAAARVCGRSCRRLRHPERQLDVGQIESLRIQAFTSQRHWPAGAFRSGWLAFPD